MSFASPFATLRNLQIGNELFGKKKRTQSVQRDLTAETNAFVSELQSNKEISDLTRQELSTKAQESLRTFNVEGSKLRKGTPGQISALGGAAGLFNQFDSTLASLKGELSKANEGTDAKYKYRQYQQKKSDLLKDRPGKRQLLGL